MRIVPIQIKAYGIAQITTKGVKRLIWRNLINGLKARRP
jgi:hypothetical protein